MDWFHFKLRNVIRITATIHELEFSTRDLSSDYIDDASYWTSAIDSTECYANPVANIRIDFGGEIYWQWAVIEIGDDFVSEGRGFVWRRWNRVCFIILSGRDKNKTVSL